MTAAAKNDSPIMGAKKFAREGEKERRRRTPIPFQELCTYYTWTDHVDGVPSLLRVAREQLTVPMIFDVSCNSCVLSVSLRSAVQGALCMHGT